MALCAVVAGSLSTLSLPAAAQTSTGAAESTSPTAEAVSLRKDEVAEILRRDLVKVEDGEGYASGPWRVEQGNRCTTSLVNRMWWTISYPKTRSVRTDGSTVYISAENFGDHTAKIELRSPEVARKLAETISFLAEHCTEGPQQPSVVYTLRQSGPAQSGSAANEQSPRYQAASIPPEVRQKWRGIADLVGKSYLLTVVNVSQRANLDAANRGRDRADLVLSSFSLAPGEQSIQVDHQSVSGRTWREVWSLAGGNRVRVEHEGPSGRRIAEGVLSRTAGQPASVILKMNVGRTRCGMGYRTVALNQKQGFSDVFTTDCVGGEWMEGVTPTLSTVYGGGLGIPYSEQAEAQARASLPGLEAMWAKSDAEHREFVEDMRDISAENRAWQAQADARNRQSAADTWAGIASGRFVREEANRRDELRRIGDDAIARGVAEGEARLAEHERQREEREHQAQAQQQAQGNQAAAAEHERVAAAEAVQQTQREQQEQERARQAQAERERQEQVRLAEVGRKAEEAARPIEFKEGIVLCQERQQSSLWRCKGPLQITLVDFSNTTSVNTGIGQACGSSSSFRDLGMTSGYRAYGCGFGIHPTARDYPGNTDVPMDYGVSYIPGRQSFYCTEDKLAYCR